MAPRRILAAALGLLSCAAIACSRAEEPAAPGPTPGPPPAAAPRIIVLLSIDTLRADHLGAYGYARFTSPNLDALAAQGVLFLDASATAPWTLPSHASILTGLHPGGHGVRTQRTVLSEEVPTLPALLSRAGWRTAAVVNSSWLKRETFGLTRDFEHYEAVEAIKDKRTPTTWVTDQAMTWIRERGNRPLFVFVHYFDVHTDYASLPEYERLFVTPYDGPADGTVWQLQLANLEDEYVEMCHRDFDIEKCNFGTPEQPQLIDSSVGQVRFDEEDVRHLEQLYDAEIRQMDAEIGRFLRLLEAEGVADETLLLVTSDHGEEFHEHGRVEHYLTMYQEVLHVPLIVRGPGIPAGVRVDAPVSIVDLAPTILARASVPVPRALDGMDLAPLWQGEAPGPFLERYLYGEAPGGLNWERIVKGVVPVYRSIRKGRFKLVEQVKDGTHHVLHDLEQDPGEQHDASAAHPEVAADLRERLRARLEAIGQPHEVEDGGLDPEEAARLRALGYVVP